MPRNETRDRPEPERADMPEERSRQKGQGPHSDLETVGDIGVTGRGSRAGEHRTSMGTEGAAEMGEATSGLRE